MLAQLPPDSQERLETFFAEIGTIVRHKKKRASFAMYALGLLGTGEPKSFEPIAMQFCTEPEQADAIGRRRDSTRRDPLAAALSVLSTTARTQPRLKPGPRGESPCGAWSLRITAHEAQAQLGIRHRRWWSMADASARVLVHLVWAVYDRQPTLMQSRDALLHDLLHAESAKLRSTLMAVGNADDHVHVLVDLHRTVALATLVQQLKGATAHAWNIERHEPWLRGSCAKQAGSPRRGLDARDPGFNRGSKDGAATTSPPPNL